MVWMAGHISADELKAIRTALRLTQKEMADRLGVSRGAYKNWEYDQVVPERFIPAILAISRGPSAPSVISGPAIPVTHPTTPMKYAGRLPCGNWAAAMDTEDFEEVESQYWKRGRYCARIDGDSCHPALQRDDFTIWEETKNPPFGKLVIAQRKGDHEATIKQLGWDSTTNEPVLTAVNRAFDDATADGWGAIAYLVYVRWIDEDGGVISFYRPEGIKPSQLTRYRE